jgi:hypothetical protein
VETLRENKIPAGTILPVILRSSFEVDRCKEGQLIRGQIVQDVPLQNEATIRRGSKIEGHIMEVMAASNGAGGKVSMQFDRVNAKGQWIPVVRNLRAIAGFMTVIEAGVSYEAPSEGAPPKWLPRRQIGGDSVYGMWGPVELERCFGSGWKIRGRRSASASEDKGRRGVPRQV